MSHDALANVDGNIVPKFLGAYQASFRDRELAEDRSFPVLLREHVPGGKLIRSNLGKPN
jgi:hypothetical protein